MKWKKQSRREKRRPKEKFLKEFVANFRRKDRQSGLYRVLAAIFCFP
jgi:hypothetical protein